MRNLLDRISKNAHWLVFIFLELISGILLFNFNRFHSSVWLSQANAVVGHVLEWEAEWISYLELKDINSGLVHENLVLQQRIESLREQWESEHRDTTGFEETSGALLHGLKMIRARVINNSITRKNNFITLDRGYADGVRVQMGVACGTGIVGIVYQTSDHYSLVIPILNSQSNISCRLRGTNFFGYLKWRGGSALDAYMEDVPHHAKFKPGQVVETSGHSNVFPAGLFVGKIVQELQSEDGLSYRLQIRLSTDFSRLRDVIIFANPDREEIDSLQIQVLDLEGEAMERIRLEEEKRRREEAEKAEAELRKQREEEARKQAEIDEKNKKKNEEEKKQKEVDKPSVVVKPVREEEPEPVPEPTPEPVATPEPVTADQQ